MRLLVYLSSFTYFLTYIYAHIYNIIDIMINEIDADGTGDIDFEEFVAVMSRKVNTSYTSSQVKNAFKVFENPMHPGYIKVEQLLEALTTYGSKQMTSEQARELISQLEPDPNGLINYEEYISMMMNE